MFVISTQFANLFNLLKHFFAPFSLSYLLQHSLAWPSRPFALNSSTYLMCSICRYDNVTLFSLLHWLSYLPSVLCTFYVHFTFKISIFFLPFPYLLFSLSKFPCALFMSVPSIPLLHLFPLLLKLGPGCLTRVRVLLPGRNSDLEFGIRDAGPYFFQFLTAKLSTTASFMVVLPLKTVFLWQADGHPFFLKLSWKWKLCR